MLGVSRATIYRYFADNAIATVQFKGKTLVRRQDIDKLFETGHKYLKREKPTQEPITEFYTSKEVQEKFGVSNSGMYKIAEREGWSKTQSRGKTLWSRSHVDRYFANQQPKEEINEWYTAADIQAAYGMTLSAIYTLVSKEGIPKKKHGNYVMYSKYHFDLAKGTTAPKGTGVLHLSRGDGEVWTDPRPTPPLSEIPQHHSCEERKIHSHTLL